MLMCVFAKCALHMRPRVQRAPGLPCALYFCGRNFLAGLGHAMPREYEVALAVEQHSLVARMSAAISGTTLPSPPDIASLIRATSALNGESDMRTRAASVNAASQHPRLFLLRLFDQLLAD